MFIYENHLGGLYTSSEEIPFEELFCETCGDCDFLIGEADTREEAWKLLKDDTDINSSGGWAYDYIQEFLSEHWGK